MKKAITLTGRIKKMLIFFRFLDFRIKIIIIDKIIVIIVDIHNLCTKAPFKINKAIKIIAFLFFIELFMSFKFRFRRINIIIIIIIIRVLTVIVTLLSTT